MKDEKQIQTNEELSHDQWLLILYSLLTDLPEKEWNNFVHDLIYKNRFSSTHKVIEVIKDFSEKNTITIEKGIKLHRARIYHKDPLREYLSNVFKNTTLSDFSGNYGSAAGYSNMQLAVLLLAVEKRNQLGEKIITAYNKWKRKRFKGFSSSGSGAPHEEKVSPGRLNPGKIRYLYLAEDPRTAVYEVRPTIGQHVSVATFKTVEKLKLYDLAGELKPQEGDNRDLDYSLFYEIQRRFSEPNTGDSYRYLPTQYIGEQIKQMGFDGLRFKSSLHKGGINVVLFDDKKCKAIRSDIIKVGDINLDFENPDIYQLEEAFKIEK